MKKKTIIALAALGLVLLNSCYADLSTEATTELPEIIVEGVDSSLTVVYGQNISMTAEVSQEGRTEADFEYLWEMDLVAGRNSDRMEVSDTKTLEMRISNTPSDSPYIISLTVTDKISGLTKTLGCRLYVGSSLGEGLLVAHTRDNGAHSEFDLVANEYVTYGYSGATRYTRDLWSLVNDDATFDENVNAMIEINDTDGGVFNENKIVIGTDKHIYALDPLTFKVKEMDSNMFNNVKSEVYKTTAFGHVGSYSTYAVVNDMLYGIVCNIDRAYSIVAFSQKKRDIFGKHNIGAASMSQGNLLVFDETTSTFLNVAGWQFMNGALSEVPVSFGFDYKGTKSIAGGGTKGNRPALLVQSADGKYHICMGDFSTLTPTVTHYEVAADELKDAVSYAFCDNADLMYFATPNAISTVVLSNGKATVKKLSWKPASSDEKITNIFQYRQAWYGTHQYDLSDYPFVLGTNRSQMIIVTYNEKTGEGKFYMRPYNVSTGLFTYKDNGSCGGFGKITAIAPTFK